MMNPLDILKNAQKLQEQFGEMQEKLGGLTATGRAGGGMVEVDVNGRMEMLAVRFAKELVSGGDVEMLQDLTVAAHSQAVSNMRDVLAANVGNIGLGLSPDMLNGLVQ